MEAEAWLKMITKKSTEQLSAKNGLSNFSNIELCKSNTNGWVVRSNQKDYRSIIFEIWLDKFTTLGNGDYRVYVGFELEKQSYDLLYKTKGEGYSAQIGDKEVGFEDSQCYLKEAALKRLDYRTPFFECYRNEKTRFFGQYLENKNPHLQVNETKGIVQAIVLFWSNKFKDIVNCIDDLGSFEKLSYDIGLRGQRLIDSQLRRHVLARQKNTCEACKYTKQVNGKWVIEVHHTKPLKDGGRLNKAKDLLVLCPNCHAIAHTSNKAPLGLDQIVAIVVGAN